MKRVLRTIGTVLGAASAALIPLFVALAPLPLSRADNLWTKAAAGAVVCGGIWLCHRGWRFGRQTGSTFILLKRLPWALLLIAVLLSAFSLKAPRALLFPATVFCAWLFSAILGAGAQIRFSGVRSLASCLSLVIVTELFLQSLPPELFKREISSPPPLALPDRGREVYRKNGFRGARPCRNCSKQLRIVTMGGSSTYGTPMYYGASTYTAILERLLEERRPAETYEVLNGGVPGFGIVQILDSLKHVVLAYQPDVVTICAWFNDSAPAPGWYGIPGKSDREAYIQTMLLLRIQELPGYSRLHHTRLFGLFRYYLLTARAMLPKQPAAKRSILRMSPEEFAWGLEQVMQLAEQHHFLPVFIYEPLHRTAGTDASLHRHRYYRAMQRIAAKYRVPLVNPLEALAAQRDAWLFYDFIHPNRAGHRVIAESLYETLFNRDKLPEKASAFLESRGVRFDTPQVQKEALYQYETAGVRGHTLRLTARAPYAEELSLELAVRVNDIPFTRRTGLSPDWKTFEVPFGGLAGAPPLIDVQLTGSVIPAEPLVQIGPREYRLPIFIEMESGGRDHGWSVSLRVQGQRVDASSRGYNVAVLDGEHGELLASAAFDTFASPEQAAALVRYLRGISAAKGSSIPPLVLIAVHTDGFHNIDPAEMAGALRSLGGSGNLPAEFESFVMIGSPGAPVGSAYEERGLRLIRKELGRREWMTAPLIEIREMAVE